MYALAVYTYMLYVITCK